MELRFAPMPDVRVAAELAEPQPESIEEDIMTRTRIALVGDFDAEVVAHRAIDACFILARDSGLSPVEPVWMPTEKAVPNDERAFQDSRGIWLVPASPYRSMPGALWAIQHARTRPMPFLGTCGGFQHLLLEYARNVLGLAADHAEINPETDFPLLHRMSCSLVEKSQKVMLVEGSPFRQIYGADHGVEDFHCRYGLDR